MTTRNDSNHFALRARGRAPWFVLTMLVAGAAGAQEAPPSSSPDQAVQMPPSAQPGGRLTLPSGPDRSDAWVPLGPAPVDQAGSGRRGYVLSLEDSEVTAGGRNQFSIHAVAANNFYREQTADFLITQRYETHTIALDYRRGFKVPYVPRFELGGQIQLHQSDAGMLNGFIQGVESLWVSMSGNQAAKNTLRNDGTTPQGTVIVRNGSPLYRADGTGAGIGDLYFTAKAALIDGEPSSKVPRVSARVGLNVGGRSQFTQGNFVGAGLSFDQKVLGGLAFHADVRAARALDRVSVWGLPLKRAAYGFSLGPEFRLPKNSSLSLQVGGSSTPYQPTGTLAFDEHYGDLTFALGQQYKAGSRRVTAQLYFRENMNWPFRVRWNTDPDMSMGLKVRIH